MNQMKDDLNRARSHYRAAPDSLETFLTRRDRRLRLKKVGTTVFALGLGVLAVAIVIASMAQPPDERGSATQPIKEGLGRIVFSRWSDGEWKLFSVRPDGSGEAQITDGSRDFYAEISPDGARIVADTELPGTDGLLVANIDGTERRTFPVGDAFDPGWSPDGTKIAFALDSGDAVILGRDHPLRIVQTPHGPSPRLLVRHGLEAELSRPVYYELAELALADDSHPHGVWSEGVFFPIEGRE